jgi:DNA polymerase
MEKDPDITKAIRQHIEMNEFFTGGFAVKGEASEPEQPPQEDEAVVTQKAAELEKIADEVRKCGKCGLGSTRTNAVPGEGNANARIMFVGEAPGADEDAQGRPFVGRAGQLLDRVIEACGLKRSDVFIGNILKCRPPENRDPRPEEIISCLPYLQRQIETINPEVIVALGAHAARTLLNTTKSIGQLLTPLTCYATTARRTEEGSGRI